MKKSFSFYSVIISLLVFFLTTDCKKDESAKLPILSTNPVTNLTTTTATSGGNISSDGGAEITARGVCLSLTSNPTTANIKTIDGTGTGQYESTITELDPGAAYHLRAYATNSVGTAYGDDILFSTLGQTPSCITQPATDLSATGAKLNGTINANFLSSIVTFEYGLTTSYGNTTTATQSPVTGNTITNISVTISGLIPNTTYHFRVKAVNSMGTSSGSDLAFTTNSSISMIDGDGNIYTSITIGTQVWLKENLKTTKYNDGTLIPNVIDNSKWGALTTGAYCDYDNTPANSTTYGRLYNWFAVDNNSATKIASNGGKNVCPTGWHVPTDVEWTTLTTSLGGESVAGGKLKETGTAHWLSPNGATNETGFTALPGGYRFDIGTCSYVGSRGFWWSSTEYSTTYAWDRSMGYSFASVSRSSTDAKRSGISVRCLRD